MALSDIEPRNYVGTLPDYENLLAQEKVENDNITYWEQLLQPAQQTLETSLSTAETQAGYDISNAYANYLQQQRAIQDSSLLGTSQQLLGTQSKSAYETAYASAQSKLASSAASAYETYSKDYETAYKSLTEEATKIQDIDKLFWDYAVSNMGLSNEDLSKIYDEDKKLTDYGRSIYQKGFETLDEVTLRNAFGDYLRDTDEDLYNYFIENPDRVRNVLAGYTTESYSNYYKDLNTVRDKYGETFAKNYDKVDVESAKKVYDTYGKETGDEFVNAYNKFSNKSNFNKNNFLNSFESIEFTKNKLGNAIKETILPEFTLDNYDNYEDLKNDLESLQWLEMSGNLRTYLETGRDNAGLKIQYLSEKGEKLLKKSSDKYLSIVGRKGAINRNMLI